MLAVSNEAATAIEGIIAGRELPPEAGVRLAFETGDSNGTEAEEGIRMDLVDAPQSGDEVLEDAQIFVEPEAAQLLDDKLLDAEIAGDRVRFAVKDQG